MYLRVKIMLLRYAWCMHCHHINFLLLLVLAQLC